MVGRSANGVGGFGSRPKATKVAEDLSLEELRKFIAYPDEDGPQFIPLGYRSDDHCMRITGAPLKDRLARIRATAEIPEFEEIATRYLKIALTVITYEFHIVWCKFNGMPGNASSMSRPLEEDPSVYSTVKRKFMEYVDSAMNAMPDKVERRITATLNGIEASIYADFNLDIDPVYGIKPVSTARNVVECWSSTLDPARYRVVANDSAAPLSAAVVDRHAFDRATRSNEDAIKASVKAKFAIGATVLPAMAISKYGAELHGAVPSADFFKPDDHGPMKRRLKCITGEDASALIDWHDSMLLADAHVYAPVIEILFGYLQTRYQAFCNARQVAQKRFSASDISDAVDKNHPMAMKGTDRTIKFITGTYIGDIYKGNKRKDNDRLRSIPWMKALGASEAIRTFAYATGAVDSDGKAIMNSFMSLKEQVAAINGDPTVSGSLADAEDRRIQLISEFVKASTAVLDDGIVFDQAAFQADPAMRDRYFERRGAQRRVTAVRRVFTDQPLPRCRNKSGVEVPGRSIFEYAGDTPREFLRQQLTNSDFLESSSKPVLVVPVFKIHIYPAASLGYMRADFGNSLYLVAHSDDVVQKEQKVQEVTAVPPASVLKNEKLAETNEPAATYPNSEDDDPVSDEEEEEDYYLEEDGDMEMTSVTHSTANPVKEALYPMEMEVVADVLANTYGDLVPDIITGMVGEDECRDALYRWEEKMAKQAEEEKAAADLKKVSDALVQAKAKASASVIEGAEAGAKRARSDDEAPPAKKKKIIKKVKKVKKAAPASE